MLEGHGWYGNAAEGLCYEGLPWFTAAAVLLGTLPPGEILWLAMLYSIGAHGIMTLNDFKSINGDRMMLRNIAKIDDDEAVQFGPKTQGHE